MSVYVNSQTKNTSSVCQRPQLNGVGKNVPADSIEALTATWSLAPFLQSFISLHSPLSTRAPSSSLADSFTCISFYTMTPRSCLFSYIHGCSSIFCPSLYFLLTFPGIPYTVLHSSLSHCPLRFRCLAQLFSSPLDQVQSAQQIYPFFQRLCFIFLSNSPTEPILHLLCVFLSSLCLSMLYRNDSKAA